MTGPAWLAAGFASLALLIAASSAARLAIWRLRGRPVEPDSDALHVLMGAAMAGMLEPRLSLVPAAAWSAVFAVAATWFGWRAIGARSREHPVPHALAHVIECAAMIYMLLPGLAASRGAAMAMPGTSGVTANPAIAFIFAASMLGYVMWTADQLTTMSRAAAPVAGVPGNAALAPRLAACYRIGMGIAMGYMLIGML